MDPRRGRGAARFAVAVVLASSIAAGCAPTPTTAPTSPASSSTPTTSASPVATEVATPEPVITLAPVPTAPPGTAACTSNDVKASHGLVEGAAGSRLTEVVIVSNALCAVPAVPALGLRDANGQVVAGTTPVSPGTIALTPGAGYVSDVRFANWCGDLPAFPLSFVVRIGATEIPVTGSAFPDPNDMPGCLGSSGPELDGTAWAPGP